MRKHTILFLKQKVFYFVECKNRKRDDVTSDATSQPTTNLKI